MIVDGHPRTGERPARGASRVSGQAQLFFDYLRQLEKYKEGRRAVHLRLSLLRPAHRREHHIRAAAGGFDALIDAAQGQLFVLENTDLFFVYKADAQFRVEKEVQKVRFLFGDDPVLKEDDDRTPFAVWFDVERNFREIVRRVRGIDPAEAAPVGPERQSARPARAPGESASDAGESLTPEMLGRIETALARADLSNLVRRQAVCFLSPRMLPEPRFTELSISIPDLGETVLPGVDLMSSHWLFRHLTRILDARMLSMLVKPDCIRAPRDIAINLNVSTVLSDAFLAFDRSMTSRPRSAVILKVRQADVFSDLATYLRARGLVRELGYRLCLDGLTHRTLAMVDRGWLGADLVKVAWHPAMADAGEGGHRTLHGIVERAGGSRMVLSRVDTPEAVIFGQSLGIQLFQGGYVDQLVAEDNRRRQFSRLQQGIRDGT
jgi:EAL domain-containing protein (putative c-di-GMP-specific phosphodiesterase class I)